MTSRGIEAALLRGWYEGACWTWLLRPLEAVYRAVAALRRLLYRLGVCKAYRAPVPVVIVGNITLGGTGKTPVIVALVEALQARGLRPGVVSRGYGANGSGSFPHTVSATSSAADCGDEPLLIFQRTGAPCVVDPDRPAAVRSLLAQHPVDIVLCDDGLQHYALARDFEIAVLDAERGLGNGFCLPAGPLREPPSRLKTVDALLWRGGTAVETGLTLDVDGVFALRPMPGQSPPGAGARVHAVAGIGQPQQFQATLTAMGYRVIAHNFPDHHRFSARDITVLDDAPVIMTEKDAVKCRAFAGVNHWYLKISARLPETVVDRIAALATRTP
ncbi:tetraacyldisaccharide 4'-kinase [Haliea sp.]|uniref:tetraacyldisaccharide 4'-kinase n=1 Tax=Haliea sp. TaxID=1932666 RepID=UPI00352872A2